MTTTSTRDCPVSTTDRHPYEKLRADWLANIRDEMIGSGVPWPRGLCLVDLQEMASALREGVRGASIPKTLALSKRWSRSQHFARSVLRSEDWTGQAAAERERWAAWLDTSAGSAMRKRIGKKAKEDRDLSATCARPLRDLCATSAELQPTEYDGVRDLCATTARLENAKPATGALVSIPQTSDPRPQIITSMSGKPDAAEQEHTPEQSAKVHQLRLAPTPDASPPEKPKTPISIFDEVLDEYTEAATRRCEATGEKKPRAPRLRPKVGRGVALAARIKDHGPEAVKLVVRWWQLSGDDRACLLRGEHPGKGPYSWDTVCRPGNFETYLEMAERWEDSGEGARVGNSDADLDRSARDAWAFLRRCIEDRAFYRREIPDPRASTWPHGIKATLSRLGTTINDLSRSTLYELDRLEAKFIQAHAQINRGTA